MNRRTELREIDEIAANRYIVDGRTDIGKLNEKLGVTLPEDEFETVGGFVLGLFGKLPAEGDQVRYENLHVHGAPAAEEQDRPHTGAQVCPGEPTRRGNDDDATGTGD